MQIRHDILRRKSDFTFIYFQNYYSFTDFRKFWVKELSEKHISEYKKLKPGGFVLIDDVPCVVEKVQTSKAGKHGAAKARMFAKGIFDGQKKIIVGPADTKCDVPMIEKRSMQVIALLGDSATLMDLEDFSQMELPITEDLRGGLVEGDEVLVWRFDRYAMIKQKK